jgi:hypothetical protein
MLMDNVLGVGLILVGPHVAGIGQPAVVAVLVESSVDRVVAGVGANVDGPGRSGAARPSYDFTKAPPFTLGRPASWRNPKWQDMILSNPNQPGVGLAGIFPAEPSRPLPSLSSSSGLIVPGASP